MNLSYSNALGLMENSTDKHKEIMLKSSKDLL
jgi:hypothetical protein